MKARVPTFALALASLLASTLSARAYDLIANIAPNQSFEADANTDGKPDAWTFSAQAQNGGAVIASDTTVVNDGVTSAKLTIDAQSAGTPYVQLLSDATPISGGRSYTFGLKANYKGKIYKVDIRAIWYNASDQPISGQDLVLWGGTLNYNSAALAGWKTKFATRLAPSTARSVRLQVKVENQVNDTGEVYLDDAYIARWAEDHTGNVLPNAGFEQDATGDTLPDNWNVTKAGYTGATGTISTSNVLEGAQNLKFTFPSLASASIAAGAHVTCASASLPVLPLEKYKTVVYYNYSGTFRANFSIRARWYTNTGVEITPADELYNATVNYASGSLAGWQMKQLAVQAPVGAAILIMELKVSPLTTAGAPVTQNAEVFFDNISVSRSTLLNAGFEHGDLWNNSTLASGADGAIDGWTFSTSNVSGAATFARDTTVVRDGIASGKITVPAGAPTDPLAYIQLVSVPQPLTSDETLTARFHYNYRGKIQWIHAEVWFWDGTGAFMSASRPIIWRENINYNSSTLSGWNMQELTVAPPAGAAKAAIMVRYYVSSSSSSYGEMWLDSAYLGEDKYTRSVRNNNVEDLIATLWLDQTASNSGNHQLTWQKVSSNATTAGLTEVWDSLQIYYLDEVGVTNSAAYRRDFNVNLEGIYDQLLLHISGSASVDLAMTVRYRDTSGTVVTATENRKANGGFQEVSFNLTNPRTLLSLEIEVMDTSTPGANDEVDGLREAASAHWVILKKPGDIDKPTLTETAQRNDPEDLLTAGVPIGLFFDREDIPALREKIKVGYDKDQWAALKLRADALLSYEPEGKVGNYLSPRIVSSAIYDRDDNKIPFNWPTKMKEAAFAYIITGDLAYADAARRIMLAAAATTEWTDSLVWRRPEQPGPERWAAFHEAEMVEGMCIAYDWIYNTLTPQERTTILDAVETKGMPYAEEFLTKATYWQTSNQGVLIGAPYAIGAITLGDETKVVLAKEALRTVVANYWYADGDTDEGMGYWLGTLGALVPGAEALIRKESLYDDDPLTSWEDQLLPESVRKTFEFAMYMSSMTRTTPLVSLNYGEASFGGAANPTHSATYFAGLDLGNPNELAQWQWEKVAANNENYMLAYGAWGFIPYSIIFHEPSVAAGTEQLLVNKYLAGSGYLFMRSGWELGQDLMLSLISGNWGGGHTHFDKNAFIIEGYGERFVVDRGTTPNYGDPAWPSHQATNNHNTVTLNGANQIFKTAAPAAELTRQFTSQVFDFSSSEAAAAYNDTAAGITRMDSFVRSVIYVRPDLYFILDEIDPAGMASVDVEWNLITRQSKGSPTSFGTTERYTFVGDVAEMQMGVIYPLAYSAATEATITGDGGTSLLKKNQLSVTGASPSAVTTFLTAFRPRRLGGGDMTFTTIDGSVTEVDVPGGSYLLRVGTVNTTINSDAKAAVLFTPTSGANVTQVGLMGGTTLTYAGVQLVNANATVDVAVEWDSGNNASGKVKSGGAASVTLRSPFNPAVTVTLNFASAGEQWISASGPNLARVALGKSFEALKIGFSRQLHVEGRNNDDSVATGGTVSYSTSDAGVATVSSTGLVTGVSVGTAVITASVTQSGIIKTDTTVVTVSAQPSGNLITNPGFESTVVPNNIEGWGLAMQSGGTYAADSTVKHGGSYSLRTTVSPSRNDGARPATFLSGLIDVKANHLYEAQFWHKIDTTSESGATGHNTLRASIYWYDDNGQRLAGANDLIEYLTILAPNDINWTLVSQLFVAADDAAYARIVVDLLTDTLNSTTLWLDDFAFTLVGENTLANSSFEEDGNSNGVPDQWTTYHPSADYASITYTHTAGAFDGSYKAGVSFTANSGIATTAANLMSPIVPVSAGQVYDVIAHEQLQGKVYRAQVFVEWLNSANVRVSTTDVYLSATNIYNSADVTAWNLRGGAVTVPNTPGIVAARVVLRVYSAANDVGQAWWDDVYLGLQ